MRPCSRARKGADGRIATRGGGVCITNPCAQWTARPTSLSTPLGRFGARPCWPQVFCTREGRAPCLTLRLRACSEIDQQGHQRKHHRPTLLYRNTAGEDVGQPGRCLSRRPRKRSSSPGWIMRTITPEVQQGSYACFSVVRFAVLASTRNRPGYECNCDA